MSYFFLHKLLLADKSILMRCMTSCMICFTLDPQVPFVPENSTEVSQYNIPCRTTDPQSAVILRSLPSGNVLSYAYDQKLGFMGIFSPGQYVCETVVNGDMVRSMVYTVVNMPSKPKSTFQLGIRSEF